MVLMTNIIASFSDFIGNSDPNTDYYKYIYISILIYFNYLVFSVYSIGSVNILNHIHILSFSK